MGRIRSYTDFGPVPWWAWTGKMTRKNIRRQLKQMKAGGIDEFFIFALYGLEYPVFLEESWFEYVDFTLNECRKLDMKVWIYDDLNWPSGAAGGKMLREHPEHRSRSIVLTRTELKPQATFRYEESAEPLRVFVRDSDGCRPADLNADQAYTNQKAEPIELLCFDLRFSNLNLLNTRGTSHSRNERGYFDMLDQDSVRCWMGYIHEEYRRRFADDFGDTLKGFFFDEPYIMNLGSFGGKSSIPWTPKLESSFRTRFGCNLYDHLPQLFLAMPDSAKVRNDYWRWVSETTGEAFGILGKWCAENNLLSTGHCVYEEPKFQREKLIATATMYDVLRHHSVPGMDLLGCTTSYRIDPNGQWYGQEPGVERNFIITAKQLTSTARYSGAIRTMAEAMGVRAWNADLNEQKLLMDWLAAMGVNLLNDNSLIYSIAGFRKRAIAGKHFTQPWYRHYAVFSEYCRHVSRFAATGKLQTEVAVLLPDTAIRVMTPAAAGEPIAPEGRICEPLLSAVDALIREHVDFELLFTPVLETGKAGKGKLQVPGASFRVVVVPGAAALTAAERHALRALSISGGGVIWVGTRPGISPDNDNKPDEAFIEWSNRQPCLTADSIDDKTFRRELAAAVRKYAPPSYVLSGRGNDMVLSALRNDGINELLFLSNQSEEDLYFKLDWQGVRPLRLLKCVDDGRTYAPGNALQDEIVLRKRQAIILTTAEKKALPLREMVTWGNHKTSCLTLDGDFDYQLTAPNIARPCFELGLAPNNEHDANQVKCWLPVERNGRHDLDFCNSESHHYWLRGTFELDCDVPDNLAFVIDDNNFDHIMLNDVELTDSKPCELWDIQNRSITVAYAAKRGINEIKIRFRTPPWSTPGSGVTAGNFIEPVVVAGSFSARFAGRQTILEKLPLKLPIGDIADHGFPQYIGEVVYRREFDFNATPERVRLEIDQVAVTAEMKLNDVDLGIRAWTPYRFDGTGTLRKGHNSMEIRITTSLGNLLRRAYGGRRRDKTPAGLLSPITITNTTKD